MHILKSYGMVHLLSITINQCAAFSMLFIPGQETTVWCLGKSSFVWKPEMEYGKCRSSFDLLFMLLLRILSFLHYWTDLCLFFNAIFRSGARSTTTLRYVLVRSPRWLRPVPPVCHSSCNSLRMERRENWFRREVRDNESKYSAMFCSDL